MLTAAGVAAGTYTLTVTGASGSLTHTVTLSVTVTTGPDFNLKADPDALSGPALHQLADWFAGQPMPTQEER